MHKTYSLLRGFAINFSGSNANNHGFYLGDFARYCEDCYGHSEINLYSYPYGYNIFGDGFAYDTGRGYGYTNGDGGVSNSDFKNEDENA